MSIAKVLLVDDETDFLDLMSTRLSTRDLDVLTAESGRAGLDALSANSDVDVVILDVSMPGMDGIEVLNEIRREFPLVETVMLTGHATVETAIQGMKRGAFDYLMKPCDMDKLLQVVTAAKAKKNAHEEKIREAHLKEITQRYPG